MGSGVGGAQHLAPPGWAVEVRTSLRQMPWGTLVDWSRDDGPCPQRQGAAGSGTETLAGWSLAHSSGWAMLCSVWEKSNISAPF